MFADVRKPPKLQIKNVISNTNGGASENDVEFIIQVFLHYLTDSRMVRFLVL